MFGWLRVCAGSSVRGYWSAGGTRRGELDEKLCDTPYVEPILLRALVNGISGETGCMKVLESLSSLMAAAKASLPVVETTEASGLVNSED